MLLLGRWGSGGAWWWVDGWEWDGRGGRFRIQEVRGQKKMGD